MNQEPGNRIVSQGEYVRKQAKRAIIALVGIFMCLLVVFCVVKVFTCVQEVRKINHIVYEERRGSGWEGYESLCYICIEFVFVCLGIAAFFCAKYTFKEVAKIDPGILPDPYLPAPDSLVRAVTQSEQTPSEQLVRPSGSQQLQP